MSKFDIALIDIDNTLFDFDKTEQNALKATMERYGAPFSMDFLERYRSSNRHLWELFEKGEIERSDIMKNRFNSLISEYSVHADIGEMNEFYTDRLSEGYYPCEGAEELCRRLYGKVKIYIVTNGLVKVQHGRLAKCPFADCFENVFISEDIGAQKPTKEYFDRVFSLIKCNDRSKAIILGDSLTSDMQGGRNAGITTCRILPKGEKPSGNALCDYEITSLSQFADIVL